eukprot:1321911-Rhodomonas_salina.2
MASTNGYSLKLVVDKTSTDQNTRKQPQYKTQYGPHVSKGAMRLAPLRLISHVANFQPLWTLRSHQHDEMKLEVMQADSMTCVCG